MTHKIRQLAKGSASALIMMLLGRVTTFVLQIMLSRYLGASAYGVMVLLTSVARLGQQIAGLGISLGIVRFGASYAATKDSVALHRVIRISGYLVLGTSVFFSLLLWSVRDRLAELLGGDSRLEGLVGIALLLLVMLSVLAWESGVIKSQKQALRASLVRELSTPVARLLIIGSLMLVGGQLADIMWGFVLGAFVALIVGIVFVNQIIVKAGNWECLPSNVNAKLLPKASNLLRVSLPMFLSGFSYTVILYVDRFMIGHYLGDPAHVGVYHAAATIAIQMNIVLMACNTIFEPMIAEAHHKGDMRAFGSLFRRIPWWSFLLTAPLVLVAAFNAGLLMSLFGKEFTAGATVLVVLLAAQAYNVFTGPVGVLLQMTGHQKFDMYINLALVTVNIILNVLLIPRYGVNGAAFATLISVIGVHSFRLIVVKRIFGIHPFDKRLLLLGGFSLIGLLLSYMFVGEWSSLEGIVISVCVLTVFSCWLWFYGFDKDDMDILIRLKEKIFILYASSIGDVDETYKMRRKK